MHGIVAQGAAYGIGSMLLLQIVVVLLIINGISAMNNDRSLGMWLISLGIGLQVILFAGCLGGWYAYRLYKRDEKTQNGETVN